MPENRMGDTWKIKKTASKVENSISVTLEVLL